MNSYRSKRSNDKTSEAPGRKKNAVQSATRTAARTSKKPTKHQKDTGKSWKPYSAVKSNDGRLG